MADYHTDKPRSKPWRARIRQGGKEHFIGYFRTRAEAERAEYELKRELIKEKYAL